MKDILYCPVCKNKLIKEDRTYKCLNNHSYDIAKKGYVNLLLANQHHSDNSGDEKEMIIARRDFLNTGKYDILRNNVLTLIKELLKDYTKISIGDLGCGEGYYTTYWHNELSKAFETSTVGLDLSKEAINQCSIRKNALKLEDIIFVIGNLNYLPFLDESLDLIINSFAKIDEKEFLRVLSKGGYYLRILPGTSHLLQMKEVLYKEVRLNEDKDEDIEGFSFIKKIEFEDNISLNNKEINDLFKMTPYYYKSPVDGVKRLTSLESLTTKIAFKILVYKKK
jgi:23S rRNA (guanine745-N1)-methyltransferase